MNQHLTFRNAGVFVASAALCFAACTKNEATESQTTGIEATAVTTVSETIAVVANATSAQSDSVYLLQPCARKERRDTVAQSSLPTAITAYLNATYAGAMFYKAYAVTSSAGETSAYAVVVYYNNKPVGLLFDAAGTFLNVLEQRARRHGARSGPLAHRNQPDSIAIAALPNTVSDYFSATYPADTLLKAYQTQDSGYVLLSKNNGLFTTVFNAAGEVLSRQSAPVRSAKKMQVVSEEAVPAAATAYLAATYPGYAFKTAVELVQEGVVMGYLIVVTANGSFYSVLFSATGQFIGVKSMY